MKKKFQVQSLVQTVSRYPDTRRAAATPRKEEIQQNNKPKEC